MKIWLARHGQTQLNWKHLMQGRTDEPLNETGIRQAEMMREMILSKYPDLVFDAVYASPLKRAVVTASVISGVPESDVITDDRIIETDFGKYEMKKYTLLGPGMHLYWVLPEVFRAPRTVETIASMKARSQAFLKELEQKEYENVLVACHGGILRALWGYLEDRPNGLRWRPRPRNCEVRIYETGAAGHRFIESFSLSS